MAEAWVDEVVEGEVECIQEVEEAVVEMKGEVEGVYKMEEEAEVEGEVDTILEVEGEVEDIHDTMLVVTVVQGEVEGSILGMMVSVE